MKVVGYFVTFLVGGLLCWLLFSLGAIDKIGAVPVDQKSPEQSISIYLSFLSVMLTAVTAVLAAVAIGIGIIAAYTFKELKSEARTTSEKTSQEVATDIAQKVAEEALSELKVKAIVFELYAKVEKEREQDNEWGKDPAEDAER